MGEADRRARHEAKKSRDRLAAGKEDARSGERQKRREQDRHNGERVSTLIVDVLALLKQLDWPDATTIGVRGALGVRQRAGWDIGRATISSYDGLIADSYEPIYLLSNGKISQGGHSKPAVSPVMPPVGSHLIYGLEVLKRQLTKKATVPEV